MGIITVRQDSPLGCWTQTEWRPAHLAGLVERVWHSEGTMIYPRERVFPSGTVELIVHLGEPYRLVKGVGTERFATACLTGMQSGPMVIEGPLRHSVLGVRLHPSGAYALLALPMWEVSGLTVDLYDLVGLAASELAERCYHAASAAERLRVAVNWVSERVVQSRGVDEAIAWIAARIERSGGAGSIAELRGRIGLSKTRLVTAFREQIGVSPKLYARIVRFRRALAMLQEGAGPLADVALATGYYDQPHMNAEFRELGGLTPREFLAARYAVGDGSSAAEISS